MNFFIFSLYCFIFFDCLNSITSSQRCLEKSTLCGSNGICLNGNCLCNLYFYGINCENGKLIFFEHAFILIFEMRDEL